MRKSHKILALTLTTLATSTTLAGGFQVNPTASSVARSAGGNGIIGEDIGDMFFNPAGLSLQQYDNSFQFSGTLIDLGNDFIDRNSQPDGLKLSSQNNSSDNTGTPIGIFYADQASWNDKVTYGIGLTVPFGLGTTYENDWIGRYHAISSELRVIDLNFAASIEVNSKLMLGGGISLQSAEATLIQASPGNFNNPPDIDTDLRVKIVADDSAVGFNLGLIFKPRADLKLGVSYRSRMKHDLDGDRKIKFKGNVLQEIGAVAPLTLPESLYLSLHYQPVDKPWSLALGARKTAWHRFDELRIDYDDQSTSSIAAQNWNDSWTAGISFDYRLMEGVKAITSIGYDESPAPSKEYRSAQVPSFDRKLVGLGLELASPFDLCNNCTAYVALQRQITAERAIRNTNQLGYVLDGYYDNGFIDVFSAHFIIAF